MDKIARDNIPRQHTILNSHTIFAGRERERERENIQM